MRLRRSPQGAAGFFLRSKFWSAKYRFSIAPRLRIELRFSMAIPVSFCYHPKM
jgi:hypothetical protein